MRTRFIHSDSVLALRELAHEEQFDVIVTSPPYNLGKRYGGGVSDKRRPSEYLNWCDDWMRLVKVVLKEEGSLFLNIGGSPKDPTLGLQVMAVAKGYFKVQNVIHWIKSVTIEKAGEPASYGHFKPINSERFLNDTHEYIFHLTHKGETKIHRKAKEVGVPYADKSNIGRWGHTGGSDRRCGGNVWFMPYDTIQSRDAQRPHPATFPIKLAKRCIALHTGDDGSPGHVLDPFMGLGTTGMAAKQLGAESFTGIDIVEDYVRIAEKSVEKGILQI